MESDKCIPGYQLLIPPPFSVLENGGGEGTQWNRTSVFQVINCLSLPHFPILKMEEGKKRNGIKQVHSRLSIACSSPIFRS